MKTGTNFSFPAARKWIRFAILPVFFLLSFFIQGCIEEPIAPNWDLELNVPVLNKSFTLQDVINKDSSVLKDYNDPTKLGLLYYADKKPLTKITVGDKLKMDPVGTRSSVTIGTISINSPPNASAEIGFSAFGVPTGNVIVPPVNGQQTSRTFDKNTAFQSATFESGTFFMTFTNNNGPITIVFNSISIVNAYTGAAILQTSSPLTLLPGETKTQNFDLAGKTLVDSLRMDVVMSTPGSGGLVVNIPSNAKTSVTSGIQNFSISQVTAPIPNQAPINSSGSFALDDSTFIQSVVISQGSMSFNFKNYFDVGLSLNFSVNNLKKPDGSSYTQAVTLDRRGTSGANQTITISDLNGWSIVSTSGNSNQLGYTVTAQVQSSTTPRTLSKTDSVTVDIAMSTLTLSSVSGKIKPTRLNLEQTVIPLKLGSFEGFSATQINFDEFLMDLQVASSPTLQIGFSGVISGKANGVVKDTVRIPYSVLGGGVTDIILPASSLNHFINSFVTDVPDTILVDYYAEVNPNYLTGQISTNDSITGNTILEIPLALGIGGGQFTDTSEINIAQANQKELDQINSGGATLTVENGLPVGIEFTAKLYDSLGNFLMSFPPNRAPNPTSVKINGATVDASGKPITPGTASITLDLLSNEFKLFTSAKKVIATIKLDTSRPNALPVQFRTNDVIKVKGSGQLNYRVQP